MEIPRLPDTVHLALIRDNEPISEGLVGIEHELAAHYSDSGRRNHFIRGRTAARRALKQLSSSFAHAEIGRGLRHEPLWPVGTTGSISHTAGLCGAVVSGCSSASAIGLDLECCTRQVSFNIARRICLESERNWALSESTLESQRLLQIFSAKEAIFKALFPVVRHSLSFDEAELSWDEPGTRFSWQPHGKLAQSLAEVQFPISQHSILSITVERWILSLFARSPA